MSEVQRKVYKGVLMRDIDTVNGTNAGRTAILNIVMQLRKCCNHPYLFPNTEDRNLDPMGEHLVENCGKVCVCVCENKGGSLGLLEDRWTLHLRSVLRPAAHYLRVHAVLCFELILFEGVGPLWLKGMTQRMLRSPVYGVYYASV